MAAPRHEDATWAATLERIAQSVVSIEIDGTRAFDTEWNTSAQATGFVIDPGTFVEYGPLIVAAQRHRRPRCL